MKRLIPFVIVAFLLALFVFAAPAGAQDPAFPTVDPVSDVQRLLDFIFTNILGSVVTAPIVAILVGFLKLIRWPVIANVPGERLSLIVAAVVYILAAIATQAGRAAEFTSVIAFFEAILPAIYQFILTLIGAPMVYSAAKAARAGIVGYERPPERQSSRLKQAA